MFLKRQCPHSHTRDSQAAMGLLRTRLSYDIQKSPLIRYDAIPKLETNKSPSLWVAEVLYSFRCDYSIPAYSAGFFFYFHTEISVKEKSVIFPTRKQWKLRLKYLRFKLISCTVPVYWIEGKKIWNPPTSNRITSFSTFLPFFSVPSVFVLVE